MDKARPSFSDDLRAIQGEVEADVGIILELAKGKRETDAPRPEPSQNIHVPAQETSRPFHQSVSRKRQNRVEEPEPQLLQNVTTRLSTETNALLTDAALRQRLSKASPATRQDIIETAVREWLRQHGYHKPSP